MIQKKDGDPPTSSLQEMKLGVWRILTEKEASLSLESRWQKVISFVPTVQTLVAEVYSIDPQQTTLIVLSKIWSSFEDVFLLHLSTKILSIIEVGLKEGKPDAVAIVQAVAARMLFVTLMSLINGWRKNAESAMESRVTHHFQDKIFTAKLEADMPTTHDTTNDDSLYAGGVWDTFTGALSVGEIALQVIAILTYILKLATLTQHGPIFVFLCVSRPLFRMTYRRALWQQPFVVEVDNDDYVRLKALKKLGNDEYRQDIISGDIGKYIINEYEQVQKDLANTDLDDPITLYSRQPSIFSTVGINMLEDLPMVYYAANAVLNPSQFTLSKIAMLQQSESALRRSFSQGVEHLDQFKRGMSFMKRLYKFCSPANTIKDGVLAYPSSEEADRAGMSIEMRNLSFSYPGAKENAKALDDVSISIKSGQLVVLVGSNGSGKSTLVKLLARLYDATSGDILVDGRDIRDYLIADLRSATASLTQDHHLYPLSLGENIGLGNPALMMDDAVITKAAEKGGASAFLAKLKDGFDTLLDPQADSYTMHVQASDGTPLAKEVELLEKKADISGGERQRVVASRTFMRFTTGRVKLVIADEGSSALDPEAEWELFKNLRDEASAGKEGKTLMFVTHRFGHLTKYADMILCMKEGKLVEVGTHEELMGRDGEYANLYQIQAKAFEDTTTN